MQKRRLIIANWKMNPPTLAEAKKLFLGVKKAAAGAKGVDIVIAPPAVFLSELRKLYVGKRIRFGAQDVAEEHYGSHTGDVSAGMLASLGARFSIVGHSERRAKGEDNALVNKKLHMTLGAEMTPILCIGERERDRSAEYLTFIRTEITEGLAGLDRSDLSNIVIAYEPIWAIGKSADEAMDPHQVHEMVLFIKKVLIESFSQEIADVVPILYGGSVESGNAGVLLEQGAVDGFLVGHASLEPNEFGEILATASNTK